MSVRIGHARGDENGRGTGGKAGDQTGREVCVGNWYAAGWTCVLRVKDSALAEKMARACEDGCKNDRIGYDQWQRNDAWDEAGKVGFDPGKIGADCETDCSAFMALCARAAGVDVGRVYLGNGKYNAVVTWTMRDAFRKTGKFDVLTDRKYLVSDEYLRRGDILVKEPQSGGHTAMALDNGKYAKDSNSPDKDVSDTNVGNSRSESAGSVSSTSALQTVKATEYAWHRDNAMAGVYETTVNTYVRNGAGANKKALSAVPKGTRCRCYGYYGLDNSAETWKWLLVSIKQDGVTYEGFVCAEFLQKV